MTFEDNRNNRDDNDNCPNCGSDEAESVDGYDYCICGVELGPSDYDHGFVPTNPNPGADANDELGTVMAPTGDPTYRRLDRLQRRMTYTRPGFVDGIISELVDSGEGRAIVQAATEIIEKADAKESLGAKRHASQRHPHGHVQGRCQAIPAASLRSGRPVPTLPVAT